jgi:hypothetical protein
VILSPHHRSNSSRQVRFGVSLIVKKRKSLLKGKVVSRMRLGWQSAIEVGPSNWAESYSFVNRQGPLITTWDLL